jgi:hypothetical protein
LSVCIWSSLYKNIENFYLFIFSYRRRHRCHRLFILCWRDFEIRILTKLLCSGKCHWFWRKYISCKIYEKTQSVVKEEGKTARRNYFRFSIINLNCWKLKWYSCKSLNESVESVEILKFIYGTRKSSLSHLWPREKAKKRKKIEILF